MFTTRRWCLFLALPALLAGQTTKPFSCEAPAEIRTLLREASNVETERDGKRRPWEEVRDERRERIKALAAKHPDDFWVLRSYIDAMKDGPVASPELIAEFKKRYDASPGDREAAFLYAHALMGTETPKTIEILTGLIETTPSFPLPWFTMANIHQSPNFRDAEKMRTYAEGFLERCPDSNTAAFLANRLDKSDKLVAYTKALRERIAGKAEEETVPLYRSLWTLEFKVTPLAEHAQVRQRVEEDLKFLDGLDREKYKTLSYILQEGYKLTGNKEAEEKLSAEAKTSSERMPAFFRAQEEWTKANPYPGREAEPEERQAHDRKRLQWLEEWIEKIPDEEFLRVDRLRTLSVLPDTPNEILHQEGEKVLEAARRKTGSTVTSLSAPTLVADIWAKRGIELERVPALVQEGIEATERQRERMRGAQQSDLYGAPDQQLTEENSRWHTNATGWRTLVTAYAKSGKSAEAREILAKWETALAERRRRAEEIRQKHEAEKAEEAPGQRPDRTRMIEDSLVRGMPIAESQYQEALAELALGEQRKLDALTFYQSGLRALAGGAGAPPNLAKTETGRKASGLWKDLGGTQEGWQAWLDSLEAISPSKLAERSRWMAMNRAIPAFTLNDQSGKTWTLASVQGKTTLINVWATWCGPCRLELPHLQKLHDKVKEREDVQVITFNVDDNAGLVEPFLQENNYTFPVLLARSFVDEFAGPLGIPTNWISDRAASIRVESLGFGGDGEEWMKQALDQIEKVRESEAQTAR
jgi:thiol-disulfide isomerase/thioredoxin